MVVELRAGPLAQQRWGFISAGKMGMFACIVNAILAMLMAIVVVNAYDFKNYTREDMKELAKLQEQFMNQPRSVVGDFDGSCNCNLAFNDISCGCCTSFRLFSSRHKACAKAGISPKELAIILSFTFNDVGPTIKIQPEICIRLPFPLWLIRICLGVYHADFCIDDKNTSLSTFKVCLQADLVILVPVFTVDFNCLVYRNGRLDVDDTIHTERPGVITYKIGKGVSFHNPFRSINEDDDYTVIKVGKQNKRRLAGSSGGRNKDVENLQCERVSDIKEVCKPMRLDESLWLPS